MTRLTSQPTATGPAGQPPGGWVPPPVARPGVRRRLLSVLVLLTLVAGVPTVLALSVGSPLPGSLPTLGDPARLLSAPLAPSLIVNVLALVAWAAWAHFTVCVAVELSAALRRPGGSRPRSIPRMPLGGVSQQLARRLVEAALVTATVATSAGVAAGSGTILTPARPAVAATQDVRATVPAAVVLPPREPVLQPAATVPATASAHRNLAAPQHYPRYVVQPPRGGYYDSLWAVAERFLGDGQRWHEIYELNKDRAQPDGRSLTRPELIRPGWTLLLPADATGLPPTDPPAAQPATPGPQQDAGSAPAAPSGSAATPRRPDPAGALPVPEQIGSPRQPEAPWPATGTSTATPTAPSPAAPSAAASNTPAAGDERASRGDHALPVSAVSALLAAATLASLARLRHRQRRRRPAGASVPLPPQELARAEGKLRVLADPADLTFLDEALRALTLSLTGQNLPDVRGAVARPDHLELRLAAARPEAPPPFVATAAGMGWRVSAQERPLASRESLGQASPLLPLLLTVGRDPDGPVLLDLEAVGSVAIDGPPTDVLGVLTQLIAEAALAPWADGVEVLAVGFHPDTAGKLELLAPERVTTVPNLDAGLLRVLNARASRAARAGDRLTTRVKGSRGEITEEAPSSLLVVHAAAPSDEEAQQLAALVPVQGRVGVVVLAPAPWSTARATWTLGGSLPGLDGPIPTPCRLDAEQLHALADLLQTARQPTVPPDPSPDGTSAGRPAPTLRVTQRAEPPELPGVGPTVRPAEPQREADPDTTEGSENREGPDQLDQAVEAYLSGTAPVSVSLLGPVTVQASGTVEPDRRARLTEIVTYLATHRAGAALAEFDAAIWPDRAVTLQTRNQAITRARAWLGADEDGVSWLRPMTDGVLRLSSRVLVDWELFTALQSRARQPGRSSTQQRRDLQTAMRLVRGRPLAQLPARRYGWLAETYLEQEIPSAVVDVAHSLAAILLDDGDADAVIDLARLALEVDRYDERPWRDLLQGHALRGEHRQIAMLISQLHELLDVELDDELQPETAELIDRLAPRRRRA